MRSKSAVTMAEMQTTLFIKCVAGKRCGVMRKGRIGADPPVHSATVVAQINEKKCVATGAAHFFFGMLAIAGKICYNGKNQFRRLAYVLSDLW